MAQATNGHTDSAPSCSASDFQDSQETMGKPSSDFSSDFPSDFSSEFVEFVRANGGPKWRSCSRRSDMRRGERS